MRWHEPQTGLVPPAQFISILEETGMILEAGQWAIGRALQDHGYCGRSASGRNDVWNASILIAFISSLRISLLIPPFAECNE